MIRAVVEPDRLYRIKNLFIRSVIYFMEGTGSIYLPKFRLKYMARPIVNLWPDIWGEMLPMTPGEAARTELKRAFPDLKRVGWNKSSIALFDWRMPMYCKEVGEWEGAYVDLVGAYWQIYRHLWLDVKFPRGFGSLSLYEPAQALVNWKGARNALIGVIASRYSTGVKGKSRFRQATTNKYLSPHLWATIQYTLHCLAEMAEVCDCVYCMTDGYLFKDQRGARAFLNSLDEWGINYRVHWGKVDVKGWQSYAAPGRGSTMLYKKGSNGGRSFRAINQPFGNPYEMIEWVFGKCPMRRFQQ